MAENQLIKTEILFPNGNKAQSVTVSSDASIDAILSSLKIEKPKALILIFGGADVFDESLIQRLKQSLSRFSRKQHLAQLFNRGIACCAIEKDAIIIDGGIRAGVMELMGQAVADRGRKTILLGVAPSGKVTYPQGPAQGAIENGRPLDPDHSHFVLVEGKEWGDGMEIMFKLAKALANEIPVVAILANGDEISRKEVLLSVRQGWPIIIIEGTGGLADDIARYLKEKKKTPVFQKIPLLRKIIKPKKCIPENQMAEIIEEGNIHCFRLDCEARKFKNLILGKLTKGYLTVSYPTLKLAWERFALYDENAKRLQLNFGRMQKWILGIGILATFLVLIQNQWPEIVIAFPRLNWIGTTFPQLNWLLYVIILLSPIIISILVAAANKFKSGNKWIILRSGAEAIKQEIYCYRTRAWRYGDKQRGEESCETILTKRVEQISRQLLQTDLNATGLQPYSGKIPPEMYGAEAQDDGFGILTSERYLTIRLGDQINYYEKKTEKLDKELKKLQWWIYIIGGAGTFLVAIGLQLWIALTTTIVGTISTYLEYQQIENTLIQYNQAKTNLENIRSWWSALSDSEKTSMKDNLVENTEKILHSELTGWVQQMENALTKLREGQAGDGKRAKKE